MRFTCAQRGMVFISDRPDGEAIAEAERNFGYGIMARNPVLVCDPCYIDLGFQPEEEVVQ